MSIASFCALGPEILRGSVVASILLVGVGSGGMKEGPPPRAVDVDLAQPDGHNYGRVFFSPDGAQLVAIGLDQRSERGVIDFWDVKSGKFVRTVEHPGFVSSAAFTPDGKRLVTAAKDYKLRVLTAPEWKEESAFQQDPPDQMIFRLAMLPDGKRFVTGNHLNRRVWDLATREARPLAGEDEPLRGYAVSPDGKRLVVAYGAPTAVVMDTENFEIVGRLTVEKPATLGSFTAVAYSGDGKTIAGSHSSQSSGEWVVTIWDARTLKALCDCKGSVIHPESLSYTADGKLVVAVMMGAKPPDCSRVYVWEVATGRLVYQFSASPKLVALGAMSPDGKWLATLDDHSVIRVFDFAKIRKEIGK